ncbi:curlin associated repeat protein [Methylorubrum populi]|uniref:Curlin associated repeat protein n=1 Tax=Methylorubrum populi TaxID=223967 RepID=A0A160PBZ7_9HYPH|nr:curlin repeat-containing protein [Methylorubrum populi]BAU88640.1 curlin associated repeat protein [Methylorubrum populi]
MISTIRIWSPRHTARILAAFGLCLSLSGNLSAQQAGLAAPVTGQPISTEVAVEYAMIGAVSLPIRILGLNGNVAGPGGQIAFNQQIGNGNRTDINQIGKGNAAAVQIFGDGNTAAIVQQGTNNLGLGAITGSAIRFDLQQNGIGNQADLSVNAPAGANLQVRQDGNGNSVSGSVPGAANVVVNQVGNGLSLDVSQTGVPKSINIQQVRAR